MKVFTLPRLRLRRQPRDIRGRPSRRVIGLITAWRGDTRVRWRKCTECTGGVQWLNPATGSWGSLPKHIRREQADEVGVPQANIRPCHTCHEAGSRWVPYEDDDEQLSLAADVAQMLGLISGRCERERKENDQKQGPVLA